MIEIRKAVDADKPAVWQIIKAVIAGDDTYVFPSNTPEDEMIAYWFSREKYNYVALADGKVVGTFWIKAIGSGKINNVSGDGIRNGCNTGFFIDSNSREVSNSLVHSC